jgi:hypothetical protein
MKKTYSTFSASYEDLKKAAIAWEAAKEVERQAVENRREIEDWIVENTPDIEDSTVLLNAEDYEIKIVGRLNKKVDDKKLVQIARENGLLEDIDRLFRWKAEVNVAEWKKADSALTQKLSVAVETKPGRPSFDITRKA